MVVIRTLMRGSTVQDPPNKLLKLTLDSILLTLPLQSGAFKGSLARR
jgi:hypothetical protein